MRNSIAAGTLVAALLAASQPSRAEPDPDERGPRWKVAMIEWAIAMGVPAVYYHLRGDRVDDDLDWDLESWKAKLTFDAVRFDTNSWSYNAFRHPLFTTVIYEIGRTNRFGMFGSIGLATISSLVWEYLIEYEEYPSINDFIIHVTAGVEIGEPLWQLGRLLAGDHDGWHAIALAAGAWHRGGDVSRQEAVLTADLDLVADRDYGVPASRPHSIAPGAWSRIRGRLRFGDDGDSTGVTGTELASRTALAGTYRTLDDGTGALLALGTAFTYRRDRLEVGWDHVAIAHAIGPQLQLAHLWGHRVIWDLAVYGDFALIDAHVFSERPLPFPEPPPYLSALQAEGYYYGLGASATTRLRAEARGWSLDAELDAHRIWQINGGDRVKVDTGGPRPPNAHHVADWRLYGRVELGYRLTGRWALAATADAAGRRGSWRSSTRSTLELALGGLLRIEL